jgi:hypothetical protein
MEKEAQTYASRRKIYGPRSSGMDLRGHLWGRSHRLHPLAGGESREKRNEAEETQFKGRYQMVEVSLVIQSRVTPSPRARRTTLLRGSFGVASPHYPPPLPLNPAVPASHQLLIKPIGSQQPHKLPVEGLWVAESPCPLG